MHVDWREIWNEAVNSRVYFYKLNAARKTVKNCLLEYDETEMSQFIIIIN